jgi:hypothetical protein
MTPTEIALRRCYGQAHRLRKELDQLLFDVKEELVKLDRIAANEETRSGGTRAVG